MHVPSVEIPVLETARLRLRGFVPADLEPLGRIYEDEGMLRFLGTFQVGVPRAQRTIERSLWMFTLVGFGFWAVDDRESGRLVGRAGLLLQIVEGAPEVELAYGFPTEHWGKGLGTEVAVAIRSHAKGPLGLRRIVSLIAHDNTASVRVATKVGLTYERDVFHKGAPARMFSERLA
jgi:ribosomal-protein-alanine N-acetyltransferase